MKFAKELEGDAVPEWRAKYLDYKAGKKKVKNIHKELQNVNKAWRSTPAGARTPLLSQGEQATRAAENTPRRTYGTVQTSSRSAARSGTAAPPSLRLPAPALNPSETELSRTQSITPAEHAYEVGQTRSPTTNEPSLLPRYRHLFTPRRTVSTPDGTSRPSRAVRMLSSFRSSSEAKVSPDVPLQSTAEFEMRKADFAAFLERELNKIDGFYAEKEEEAEKRLEVLREQLHIMRDRRVQEINEAHRERENGHADTESSRPVPPEAIETTSVSGWLQEIEGALGIGPHRFGENSQALSRMAREHSRDDYTRRPQEDVSYHDAKRKLKQALREFYRGLELLKSYAILNRTAFRKINKKYDKVVRNDRALAFFYDHVNKAHFHQSGKLDTLLSNAEDLFARYFESGNRKVAVDKLRSKHKRQNYEATTFRNGLFFGVGCSLGLAALDDAIRHMSHNDPSVALQTTYLLQLYGGFYLCLYLMLLYVLVCRFWIVAKINYVFIFEFDTRHYLDWRQLAEIPCVLTFVFGLMFYLNFKFSDHSYIFRLWPVFLIAVTASILVLPYPVLYFRSRLWFVTVNLRVLLSGFSEVFFKDLFIGDMWCSLTYSLGNLELFTCLYQHDWNYPTQCNSSHSRAMGFLSALPSIWRALQCIRRYLDTGDAFPHLANFAKYLAGCLFYMTLSLYRIQRDSTQLYVSFLCFATINSIYTSVWDLIMDWSLGNYLAPHKLLRRTLGFERPWIYYVAMVLDPLLRFNWLLYVVLPHHIQHSAALSFGVAVAEVSRRGMWALFRVENEHCTNVTRLRAHRDPKLPYQHTISGRTSPVADGRTDDAAAPPSVLGTPGLRRMGTIIHEAHARDFERRLPVHDGPVRDDDDDDDEEDEDTADVEIVEDIVRQDV